MKRISPKPNDKGLKDWRQAIFKRVVSPPSRNVTNQFFNNNDVTEIPRNGLSQRKDNRYNIEHRNRIPSSRVLDFADSRTRTSQELRSLWRNAIMQQIILNRMEKQNTDLQAQQQQAVGKRAKLSYTVLGTCDEESAVTWDTILREASTPKYKVDLELLTSASLRGIPKSKRGQLWQFFMDQKRKSAGFKPQFETPRSTPYAELKKELTTHQHAILIDLGRTFPGHPFFASPLGTGQLALFNLLKAYSILDPDVGYCQGLSFVAGILLMHLEEENAFDVLKYFMFDLGAREHYKCDMTGLEVKLYQLTRMVHDQDPEIQSFLHQQDVLPSLYAAPWFLTIFASQFPLGFAVRVIDFVLLHGVDVITKFAVTIIIDHKEEIMKCTGLEKVMECLRVAVTKIGSDQVNRYIRRVVEMEPDTDRQLMTYGIEYSVLHSESFIAFTTDGYCKQPSRLPKTDSKAKLSPTPGNSCADCLELQFDIITLLKYLDGLSISLEHAPEDVAALSNKYFPNKKRLAQREDESHQSDIRRLTDDVPTDLPASPSNSSGTTAELEILSESIESVNVTTVVQVEQCDTRESDFNDSIRHKW